jgi:hypothetical protein
MNDSGKLLSKIWLTLENILLDILKISIYLPYDLAIPLLDIYSRKMKACVHKKTYTRMCTAALSMMA